MREWQDDIPYYRELNRGKSTARKSHHCDACDGVIIPGQKYKFVVCITDDGFQIFKEHSDDAKCVKTWQQVIEDERKEEEARNAYYAGLTFPD